MLIVTAVLGYTKSQIMPFYQSLMDSGFQGSLIAMVNDCEAAQFLKSQYVVTVPDDRRVPFPVNTRRFKVFYDLLRGTDRYPTIICDSRDVIFQENPEFHMPNSGVNVFCEDSSMTIGKCPYNSMWMGEMCGRLKWDDKPIICAGVTSGQLEDYCREMWERLSTLPPKHGLDQAVHNDLVYSGKLNAKVWANEEGPVYTVGYIPRESVSIEDGVIKNRKGDSPCVVHQYDRHQNLRKGIPWQ